MGKTKVVDGADNPFNAFAYELKEVDVVKVDKEPLGVFVKALVSGGQPFICRLAEVSPAEKAGIRVGDYVLTVNGHRVESKSQMKQEIGRVTAGTVRMVVARRRSQPLDPLTLEPPSNAPRRPNFNYHICRLDPQRRPKLGMELSTVGDRVMIVSVSMDGSAFWSGMQARDHLLAVGGEAVRDQKHCEQMLDAIQGSITDVLIERPVDAESSQALDEPSLSLQRFIVVRNQAGAGVPDTPPQIKSMMQSRMDSIMKNIRAGLTSKPKKPAAAKAKSPAAAKPKEADGPSSEGGSGKSP